MMLITRGLPSEEVDRIRGGGTDRSLMQTFPCRLIRKPKTETPCDEPSREQRRNESA